VKNRLPSSVDSSCLLFQGSPDLIILPKHRAEGILNTASVYGDQADTLDCQESATFQDEKTDASQSSQESGRFQIAHQMTNTKPYRADSALSERAGELMAALHTLLVCRAVRKYIKQKQVSSLTAHGLHIHRAVGIVHLKVTLSKEDRIQVSATHLVDGVSSPDLFCATIKYFMDMLSEE